jgi:hypothetical protein
MLRRLHLRAPSLPTAISLLALSIASTGTAYAAAPQLFSLADQNTPSHTAVVNAAGALTVNGSVLTALRGGSFSFPAVSFSDAAATAQFTATNATLAFTGFRVANDTSEATTLTLYEYASTSTACATSGNSKFLGQFSVLAGDTVDEQLATPLIVKPIAGGAYWCFVTYASGSTGTSFYTTYSGFPISGSFSPSKISVKPGHERQVTRRDLHLR